MTSRPLLKSFNWAIEGIVYALRTQRNMRIHTAVAVLVVTAGVVFKVSRVEFMILIFTIAMVMAAELVNTAVEASIDLVATTYDPLAKIAKDVAAAAVLVSSIAAIAVGYLVFFDRINPFTNRAVSTVLYAPVHVTMLAIFLSIAAVLVGKALTRTGTFLRGGMPSGHVAVSAALLTAITIVTENALIATLALLMVILVAQSRIEAGFHTLWQAIAGAVLGILITVLLFQVFGIR